jgi:8-oxo-dGTP diphosphatase
MRVQGCAVGVRRKCLRTTRAVRIPSGTEVQVRERLRRVLEEATRSGRPEVALQPEYHEAGLPALAVAKLCAQEIYRCLRGNKTLRSIEVCVADREAYPVFRKGIEGYLGHVVEVLQAGPFLTVDAIIEVQGHPGEVVVIERSNPPFGFALPGGFVDHGESCEAAAVREAKEETGLDIYAVRQFHTYSDPRRDPRFHTVGTVFIARARGIPRAGDDAAALRFMRFSEVRKRRFAFDHKQILEDYIASKKGKDPFALRR